MSNKNDGDDRFRDDDEAIQLALFRYGVIGPLVEQEEYERGEITAMIREITANTHYLPGTGRIDIKERTVYEWLRRYKQGGVEALRQKVRSDCGISRVLDEEVLKQAIVLRKEVPERWTSTLLDIMKRTGTFDNKVMPHRSTLDRYLVKKGASRRQLRTLGTKRTIKMHFDNFADLWVGDYKHGPIVLGPDGKPAKAKLSAFIDHATRYPVSDRWYLSEKLNTLRDTLLRAFLIWGIPKVLYVDRGAVYRSEQLAYSIAQLGKKLVHSRPYYSQGRGVIEKWWQHTDAFLAEIATQEDPYTLHELNSLWEAWRELRYCQKVHSELKKTPNEAIANVQKNPIDPGVARDLFLVKAKRKVNKKTACVSIEGQEFLCESFLRGQWVTVRYDISDLSSVLIFQQNQRIQRAFLRPIGEKPEPHPDSYPEHQSMSQSIDYLALLREDFDKQLLEQAKPLAYTDLTPDAHFDVDNFIQIVCDLAGLHHNPNTVRELKSFWKTFGPIPEQLVRIGTEHAVRLHTRGRHVRIYLHSIQILILAHIKSTD